MDRCVDEQGKEGGHEGGNGKLCAYLDMYLYQWVDIKEESNLGRVVGMAGSNHTQCPASMSLT